LFDKEREAELRERLTPLTYPAFYGASSATSWLKFELFKEKT